MKRSSNSKFDVAMGSYDGAEICELVGLFILHHMGKRFDKNTFGLYRDDGLAVFKNLTARTAHKTKDELIRIFAEFGLKITTQANMKFVDFLDVTLNLQTGTYRPYMKPDNNPLYVNNNSSHPPSVLNQIPIGVNKRISQLSYNKDVFDNAKQVYIDALKTSGYDTEFTYENSTPKPDTPTKKRNRKRNIIWFNPPFSKNISTNIAGNFLRLLRKHFPPRHTLHKIFNKNNTKASYSCTPNVKNIISKHNKKILDNTEITHNENLCNCRNKRECPLKGSCLIKSIVYSAEIKTTNTTKTYIGMTGGTFKIRYNNHKKSFKNEKYEKESELSKHIWSLKKNDTEYTIHWKIIKQVATRITTTGQCSLCLEEKLCILNANKTNLLNKRSELISKCRHYNTTYLHPIDRG